MVAIGRTAKCRKGRSSPTHRRGRGLNRHGVDVIARHSQTVNWNLGGGFPGCRFRGARTHNQRYRTYAGKLCRAGKVKRFCACAERRNALTMHRNQPRRRTAPNLRAAVGVVLGVVGGRKLLGGSEARHDVVTDARA